VISSDHLVLRRKLLEQFENQVPKKHGLADLASDPSLRCPSRFLGASGRHYAADLPGYGARIRLLLRGVDDHGGLVAIGAAFPLSVTAMETRGLVVFRLFNFRTC